MACPTSLQVALKEWAVVCRALEQGRQSILLRKGGISENRGMFEVEHRAFVLFPTYLHQSLQMLKAAERPGFEPRTAEPNEVTLSAAGVVTDIVEVTSRDRMDALEAEHVWAPPLIDMRFSYRPSNPLYLMLVRAYRLQTPVTIENTLAYGGCKSWVPLDRSIDVTDATPVLDDASYDARRTSVLERLKG